LSWPSSSRSYHRANWPPAFVDQQQHFVSKATVYRLLKAHDPITRPTLILLKAADRFAQPTTCRGS
jgi:hypothetical protein